MLIFASLIEKLHSLLPKAGTLLQEQKWKRTARLAIYNAVGNIENLGGWGIINLYFFALVQLPIDE